MNYVQANPGRIFVARLEDGEDVFEQLKFIIKKEEIKAGYIQLLGAFATAKVILGSVKGEYPPTPAWWEFDDEREVLGFGIFAPDNGEPKIHLHASFGHHTEVKTGCVRENAKVYLTIEAVIQEITGADITRELDSRYNASLLKFKN